MPGPGIELGQALSTVGQINPTFYVFTVGYSKSHYGVCTSLGYLRQRQPWCAYRRMFLQQCGTKCSVLVFAQPIVFGNLSDSRGRAQQCGDTAVVDRSTSERSSARCSVGLQAHCDYPVAVAQGVYIYRQFERLFVVFTVLVCIFLRWDML